MESAATRRLYRLFNDLSVAVHRLDTVAGEGLDGRYQAARSSGASIVEALFEALTEHVGPYLDDDGLLVDVAVAAVPDSCVPARDALVAELDTYLELSSQAEAAERRAGWSASP